MYVLIDILASRRQKKPLYFKAMTAIGPMTTPVEAERATFYTMEQAMQCPAIYHPLSCYEVKEVK
jgi:hypothetical protein